MASTKKNVTARTQQKRDSEALWETNNPTLLNGEIAVVKTTDYGTRLKVGDGTSAYKSLDFIGNATKAVAYTLTASGWDMSNVYSFEATYPAAKYDLSIEVASSATKAQCEAFTQAMICGSATSNTIKALNGKPTVNIPVILRITYR